MLDLQKIIKSYPISFCNRSQLASLIRDYYPSEKRATNIALAVYDCGMAYKISCLKSIDQTQLSIFSNQLMDEFGLQEQYAIEGIHAWATAFGISVASGSNSQFQQAAVPPNGINHNPNAYATAGQIVNGSGSDYDLIASENGFVISKFRGFDEADVVVPNIIDGKKIIGIGENAYLGCSAMKTLVVSDGVRFIENGAFAKCSKLTNVTLPETLEKIGTIGKPARGYFVDTDTPKGVFEQCNIQFISLPAQLTYLGDSTFSSCENLTSINLPNSISELNRDTFYKCTKLSKIFLPENLSIIGSYAFDCCTSLKNIHVPIALREIDSYAFCHCVSLTEIILNEGLIKIGKKAFQDCRSLIRVLIPSTIKEIRKDAFIGCHNLTMYCYAGSYGLEYARKYGYPIQNAANFSQ